MESVQYASQRSMVESDCEPRDTVGQLDSSESAVLIVVKVCFLFTCKSTSRKLYAID
jgi:hypothetical protein